MRRTDGTGPHGCARCGTAVDPAAVVVHTIGADTVTYGHASVDDCIRLLRAQRDRDVAQAYWSGMLEAMALEEDAWLSAWLDMVHEKRAGAGWSTRPEERQRRADAVTARRRWRVARLRAIAASEMWLPWWERRKAVQSG